MPELKKRILIVDDSEDLREVFRIELEEAGYDVVTASGGAEGLEEAKAQRPDLILLDLIMPGMDGLELMTRLRSDLAPPIPPMILCSGFDLTEEEALRRGALAFVRKPVARQDLLEFVALALLGERISLETAARERANSAAARTNARRTAATFVTHIRRAFEDRTAGQLAWLAAYFGLETAVAALVDGTRLTVLAAAGDPSFTVGLDLGVRLPPSMEILESRSSLVLADASSHACFSTGPYRLEGVRFFAGVPLFAPEGIPIGVLCLLDPEPRQTRAEDLLILEHIGRQGSLLFKLVALGRPESELPGRLGPGLMLRPTLEVLVDAEVRLLRQSGGSMTLAIVEMTDPDQMREVVLTAGNRERLGAGLLSPTRVVVYKRDSGDGAASQLHDLLSGLQATTQLDGVGVVSVGGTHLPAIGAHDLIRLAELGLEESLRAGGGTQRLVLQHETAEPATL